MTDFELNKAIAEAFGWKVFHFDDWILDSVILEINNISLMPSKTFNFNNWSDLMPLVVEYKLSSWQDEATGDWYVNQTKREMNGDYLCDRFENDIENPKLERAYALCLLKVLEGEQANEL